MNFKNFEVLYGETKQVLAVANYMSRETDALPKGKATVYSKSNPTTTFGEQIDEWVDKLQASAKKQQQMLLKMFKANFPRSLSDARRHPLFSMEQFHNLLLRNPELAEDNLDVFADYMVDLHKHSIEVPELAKLWKATLLNH